PHPRAAQDPELAAAGPAVFGRVRADLRPRLWLLAMLAFAIAFVTGPMNTFLFVYAENALGMSRSSTAAMVLAAAPVGLAGLLAGRWAADRLGRRVTAAGAQALVALAGMLTYSGSRAAVAAGYLAAVLVASAYAPAIGALGSELFPTRVRATVAGWLVAAGVLGAVAGLVAFGLLTDALDSFATAAILICAPVVVTCMLFARLPETRGLELEQSAPDCRPPSRILLSSCGFARLGGTFRWAVRVGAATAAWIGERKEEDHGGLRPGHARPLAGAGHRRPGRHNGRDHQRVLPGPRDRPSHLGPGEHRPLRCHPDLRPPRPRHRDQRRPPGPLPEEPHQGQPKGRPPRRAQPPRGSRAVRPLRRRLPPVPGGGPQHRPRVGGGGRCGSRVGGRC